MFAYTQKRHERARHTKREPFLRNHLTSHAPACTEGRRVIMQGYALPNSVFAFVWECIRYLPMQSRVGCNAYKIDTDDLNLEGYLDQWHKMLSKRWWKFPRNNAAWRSTGRDGTYTFFYSTESANRGTLKKTGYLTSCTSSRVYYEV